MLFSYIEDKLYDCYDNIYIGLLNYDIYDENCDSILKTVTKVNLGTGVYQASISNVVNIYPNPFYSELNMVF